MDNPSKSPRNEESRKKFRQILIQRFEKNLPDAIERYWELPSLNIYIESTSPYPALLIEVRELFLDGHFYSCVAMCGIVGERLIKDLLRTSVLIEMDGQHQRPDEKAFDQLERVEVSGIVKFLKESGVLSEDAALAAEKLGTLRNAYAHARGKDYKRDAISAIGYLQDCRRHGVYLQGLRSPKRYNDF
jgi:hypothetical protein